MEIGEIVEVGDRQIEVTPRRETPTTPRPEVSPEKTPERVKEPS